MERKTWEMNENQKAFVNALADYKNGATLFELKLAGKPFASGAINVLLSKGIVIRDDEPRVFKVDLMFNGIKVGEQTKKAVVYRLAK